MAIKYGKKKLRQNNIFFTIITVILIFLVFLSLVGYFYEKAEDDAYEMLHLQTKQIKDDLTLQMFSDRENLITMANFASKMYSAGEGYDRIFESFKAIGLFSNVGILDEDNRFFSKEDGRIVNLTGKLSFEEEAAKGMYISNRTPSFIYEGEDVIRIAVPIVADGKTVGILYGVIRMDVINQRYNEMAKELDAQLFVYDKSSGDMIIDTINRKLGNISFLEQRNYNNNYSYEEMRNSESGYSSFVSAYTGEDLYLHYSTMDEEIGWVITLARYESQVFENTHVITRFLLISFIVIVLIIALYIAYMLNLEKRKSAVTTQASSIRKLLLDYNQQNNNVIESLKKIQSFSASRSAFYVDTDGEDLHYISPALKDKPLCGEDQKYFIGELFRYAGEFHNINLQTLGYMRIVPNNHLLKTNKALFDFFKTQGIKEVSFAIITDENNHRSMLGVINSGKVNITRNLLEDVAVCFSIAVYNKKHLSRTEVAASTDSLTGASNRVSFKRDLIVFDEEKPKDFSCIYIDVNELHLRNNRYGHAAGDEMLIYIANTLKEVFYGHHIYRMGGDEFLVFAENTEREHIKKQIEIFIEQLKPVGYNVAIGMSYRSQNTNTEEMVREAEVRMYEAKAQYYQNKENKSATESKDYGYIQIKTGIQEIDTMISIMKEHYNGIYRVCLDTDKARRILMPSYLGYNEHEEHYSKLLSKYIHDIVHPDFHRPVSSFLNYDAIKRQLMEGKTPTITYKKSNAETVTLSVYKLSDLDNDVSNTLWVFAKG